MGATLVIWQHPNCVQLETRDRVSRALTILSALSTLLLWQPARAADDDIGTCLTVAGVWVAPWTDPVVPACGEDCGDAPEDSACDGDGDCLSPGDAGPRMPEPRGLRCLDPGAECGPQPTGSFSALQNLLLAPPSRWGLDPPNLGSLPGAGPPTSRCRGATRDLRPPVPPPRGPRAA